MNRNNPTPGKHGVTHITSPQDNIFTDLGLDEASAAALLKESDKKIEKAHNRERMKLAERLENSSKSPGEWERDSFLEDGAAGKELI